MDIAEQESQINYFDSTINDTLTESIPPSIEPFIQETINKNNSGLFSSCFISINGTFNLNPPVPLPQGLQFASIKQPSLPMIPEPNAPSWQDKQDYEEEKVPPPPSSINLSKPPSSIVCDPRDKKTSVLTETDQVEETKTNGITNRPSIISSLTPIPAQAKETKNINANTMGNKQKYHAVRFGAIIKLESLGKGAFGEVFRVFDKDERKFYAMKEIRRQAFERETQFNYTVWTEIYNLMRVHHAHNRELLNVLGINFDTEAGVCSFLMELGKGTLHEYSQFRTNNDIKWTEEELISVLWQLVKQIDMLRALGIFHRDVKPENIILTDKDSSLKLSDLGCAWLGEEGGHPLNIAGTPYFMAPELTQAIIKKQRHVQYDPYSTDLYSIGITILKLMFPAARKSELLVRLEDDVKKEYGGLYLLVKDLVALDTENRRRAGKKILELDAKGLSINSKEENSYKSFLFQKIVDRSGNSIDPSLYFEMFIFEEAEMIIQNEIVKEKRKNSEVSLREIEWRIALAQCYIHQKKHEMCMKELEELLKLPILQNEDDISLLTRAKVQFWMGYSMASTGKFEDSIDKLQSCLEIRTKILGEHHEDIAIIHLRLGYTYFNQGKYDQAKEAFEKCISINRECQNENSLNVAKSYNNIGVILETQRKYDEARENLEKALQIYMNLYGEDYPYVADQYNNIGNTFFGQEKYTDANEYYFKALKIKKKYFGENSPEVALVNGNIASTLDKMFQFTEAIKYLRKSYEIYRTKYGDNHPELAQIYFLIGNTLSRQSKYQESLENHMEALKIMKSYYSETSPHIIENYLSCGKVNELLADYDQAYNCYVKAAELHITRFGENLKTAQIYKRLALLLFTAKRMTEAIEYADKASNICSKISHKTPDLTCLDCLEILAMRARKEKKYEEALTHYEKLLNLKLQKFGENHHECGLAYLMVGNAKRKLKQLDQAMMQYRKATVILSKVLPEEHYGIGDIYYRTGLLYKDQKKYMEGSRDLGRALEIFSKCFDKKHPLIKKCQQKIAELNQLYLIQQSEICEIMKHFESFFK